MGDKTIEQQIEDILIQFYADANHYIAFAPNEDMKIEISKTVGAISTLLQEARKDERKKVRMSYAKRYPLYTKKWLADYLGITRPTLDSWLKDMNKMSVGAFRKLAELKEKK